MSGQQLRPMVKRIFALQDRVKKMHLDALLNRYYFNADHLFDHDIDMTDKFMRFYEKVKTIGWIPPDIDCGAYEIIDVEKTDKRIIKIITPYSEITTKDFFNATELKDEYQKIPKNDLIGLKLRTIRQDILYYLLMIENFEKWELSKDLEILLNKIREKFPRD